MATPTTAESAGTATAAYRLPRQNKRGARMTTLNYRAPYTPAKKATTSPKKKAPAKMKTKGDLNDRFI